MFRKIAVFILLGCSSLMAQASGEKELPVPNVTQDIFPTLAKLGVVLLVIVALIYATMIVLRKMSLGRSGFAGGKGSLEVLERSYFAPKKFVCLLRVEKKVLLVGVAENSINLLADVSDQEFGALEAAHRKAAGKSFGSYLKQARTQLSTLVSKV